MIEKILASLSLNEKEVKVFKKLLEFGTQPASQVSRLSDLPRNTVRDILDKLTKKGLLLRSQKANVQYYGVESLKNITFHVQQEKAVSSDRFDRQLDMLKTFGDVLVPVTQRGNRPKITFYDGTEGLEKVYEDTLTSRTDILAFASLCDMYSGLKDYFPSYFRRRTKKKIKIRAIFPASKEAYERAKKDKEELRESVIVPEGAMNFTPEINIYDGKVIFVSWKEKIAIQIQSQEIYQAMKAVFELSWAEAKRLSKKL